jgi:hypothetical protein
VPLGTPDKRSGRYATHGRSNMTIGAIIFVAYIIFAVGLIINAYYQDKESKRFEQLRKDALLERLLREREEQLKVDR